MRWFIWAPIKKLLVSPLAVVDCGYFGKPLRGTYR